MKSLYIHRGKSQRPFVCANGDTYDSTGELFNEQGHSLWKSDHVNTDHTTEYKGGKLLEGIYRGIVGDRKTSSGKLKRGIRVYQLLRPTDVPPVSADAVTMEMLKLPSKIPNPNHAGKFYIEGVWVHSGGVSWDFSHGCLSVLEKEPEQEYTKLMSCVADNENIEIILA